MASNIRDTQVVVEVLRDGDPNLRNTQVTTEVLRDGDPNLRNTQVTTEVLRDGDPNLRNTQVVVEVLRQSPPERRYGDMIFLLDNYIIAYFSSYGAASTGLTPTLTAYNVATSLKALDAVSMTEIGGGFYKYLYSNIDNTKNYVFTADGGATLGGYDRYPIGHSKLIGPVNTIESSINNMYYAMRQWIKNI